MKKNLLCIKIALLKNHILEKENNKKTISSAYILDDKIYMHNSCCQTVSNYRIFEYWVTEIKGN